MASRINAAARPIGVFDSGLGGLTVVRQLARLLPAEDIIYLGDLARLPYGTKSDHEIKRYAKQAAVFLNRFRIKFLVVACNSASAVAFSGLKKTFPVPMVGVIEPSAREAVHLTRSRRIGVIGTEATIRSGAYKSFIKDYDRNARVSARACPLFVPLVETGWLNGRVVSEIARRYLSVFKRGGVDTLVLGCTHYPLLAPAIRKVMGRHVRLVGSGDATAHWVKDALREQNILRPGRHRGRIRCFVTDFPGRFRVLGRRFLGRAIQKKVLFTKEVRIDV